MPGDCWTRATAPTSTGACKSTPSTRWASYPKTASSRYRRNRWGRVPEGGRNVKRSIAPRAEQAHLGGVEHRPVVVGCRAEVHVQLPVADVHAEGVAVGGVVPHRGDDVIVG